MRGGRGREAEMEKPGRSEEREKRWCFRSHCLKRWEREEAETGARSSKTMAYDIAADEIRGNSTVSEVFVATVPTVVAPAVHPCGADEPHGIGSFTEQSPADEPLAMGTAPEFCTLEAPVKELVCKDTNSDHLELNNNNQQDDSVNDSMNDHQEQTTPGICSQATQSKVDLTEIDASDGMLLDGLRTML